MDDEAIRGDPSPASFAQQRMWLLDRISPGSAAYNVGIAFDLAGPLDMGALRRSLDDLAARHESLRTVFGMVDGEPVQVITPPGPVAVKMIDLRAMGDHQRDAAAERAVAEEARVPFDLARGPLFRAVIVLRSEQEHSLLLAMHHIVSDGWSIGVLLRELSALYEAHRTGGTAHLPDLPVQYADYARRQRQRLRGDELESTRRYWQEHLGGELPVMELPSDRPRPRIQSGEGAVEVHELSPALTQALATLGRRERTTMFMTLLAAVQTLLHRYTGLGDIIVGSPIANRNRTEFEGLVGLFVNTLAFRTDLSGDPGFRELLGRVRDTALDGYAHRDLPFEQLVEALQPRRDPGRTPFFAVMFAYQNAPAGELAFHRITVRPMAIHTGTSKFDLTLTVRNRPSGLLAEWEYDTALFDAETIRRTHGHFRSLLEGIVADPAARLSQLPLLTGAERRQVLVQWNRTKTSYPRDACVHGLFEAQVRRTPDAVAVSFDDGTLTYRQLNEQANRLAGYLRSLGVRRGDLVGVRLGRSACMVTAQLAILKAGGAYVPLDPEYPATRLAFMVENAGAKIVLTPERLEAQRSRISEFSAENPGGDASPDDLAYVVYTSGSTGTPTGVAVPHRAITRLVINTDYIAIEPSDRIAQASNSSFDAITFELWGALLNGARLIGVDREHTLSPRALAAFLKEQGITVLFVTTALFNTVAREVPGAFGSLRHLLFGGEAVDPGCVRRVLENDPPERLLHVYGPTESTTFASWYTVTDVPRDALTVPIGRPIANTTMYVLDRHLEPVPVGVTGELHIGGDGLARGYRGRPELTAEKFIADPFGDEPEARLYRTGDLVRRLADGNVEFVGRIDHQVKLRGFRIELGEIETVLGQFPALGQAVVLVREDEPGDRKLVAYVVFDTTPPPTVTELRRFLQDRLPQYMLPSAFVTLDALPLTPNGKIDRRNLPRPDTARPDLQRAYAAPRNDIEESLVTIWQDVLGVDRIGITDDFFELGGHSLMAVGLFDRIETRFGRALPLASLFAAPTIEQLAAMVEQDAVRLAPGGVVTLRAGTGPDALFLVPPPGDQVFCFRELVDRLPPEVSCYGLEAPGLDGVGEPLARLQDIAAVLVERVCRVQPAGPYRLCGFCQGGLLAYEIARQLTALDRPVALLALLNTLSPDAARGADASADDTPPIDWRLAAAVAKRFASGAGVTEIIRRVRRAGAEASGSYVALPYPGRVVLFKTTGDPAWSARPADGGWNELARGGVQTHTFPCRHLELLKEPHVCDVARAMQRCIGSRAAVREPAWADPPRLLELGATEAHVWRVPLDVHPDVVDRLAGVLSDDERARADRYRFPEHRRRFIVRRGVLRTILARYLGTSPGTLRFQYTSHGKPSLAGGTGPAAIEFNLAHSAELALVAVTRGKPVGVDLERTDARDDRDRIAEEFFCAAEAEALRSLPPEVRTAAFFNCWTRKEAVLKALGTGLSLPLKDVEVSIAPGRPARLLSISGDARAASGWRLYDLSPGSGWAAALAVEDGVKDIACFDWPREQA